MAIRHFDLEIWETAIGEYQWERSNSVDRNGVAAVRNGIVNSYKLNFSLLAY